MFLLPPADCRDRITAVLDAFGVRWHRADTRSDCYVEGPCQVHPDRGNNCRGAQGVTYYVHDGPLKGVWRAWGVDADLLIFDMMTARLDELWREHLAGFSKIAAAMRSVGR